MATTSNNIAKVPTFTAGHIKVLNNQLIRDAMQATEQQKSMSFVEAVQLYPKAIMWSVILSSAIVMEGFDLVLINSLFAFPQFAQRYGERRPDGSYQISSAWQSGLTNGALVGQLVGLLIAGSMVEKWGYRSHGHDPLHLSALLRTQPRSPRCGRNFLRHAVGSFPSYCITTSYAADIGPVALRGYLTTYVNICFVMGQLLSTGILRALIQRNGQWAYRIPFGLQWVWPVPILIGCFLAPESPWWHVRHGKPEEAKAVLLCLNSSKSVEATETADRTLAMIIYTNELERLEQEGTTYKECFQRSNLRRTEISCMAYVSQTICVSSLMGYSVYFYQQAGLQTFQALNLSIGQFAIGFVGTLFSWWLMGWFGRRTLYIGGISVSFVLLICIGATGIPKQTEATGWVTGSLFLVLTVIITSTLR